MLLDIKIIIATMRFVRWAYIFYGILPEKFQKNIKKKKYIIFSNDNFEKDYEIRKKSTSSNLISCSLTNLRGYLKIWKKNLVFYYFYLKTVDKDFSYYEKEKNKPSIYVDGLYTISLNFFVTKSLKIIFNVVEKKADDNLLCKFICNYLLKNTDECSYKIWRKKN